MLDILIHGGLVLDGSGKSGERRDVAIQEGRFIEIGSLADTAAVVDIDATDLVVVPGFIDPHSHSDWTVHSNRDAESTIVQGVTTEVVGNCGITNAPVSSFNERSVSQRLASFGYSEQIGWNSFGSYLADVESGGISQNLAWLVGHSTLREAAGLLGEEADEDDLRLMEGLLEEAMDAGAFGMSSGLEYGAGRFAKQHELDVLAKIVGRRDGYYTSHIRNRDTQILDAVKEFLGTLQVAGAAGQLSHLNTRKNTGASLRAGGRGPAHG